MASIIAEINRMLITPDQLALLINNLLFSDHLSIYSFSSNQRFQAIEFVDRPAQEKLDICRINLS